MEVSIARSSLANIFIINWLKTNDTIYCPYTTYSVRRMLIRRYISLAIEINKRQHNDRKRYNALYTKRRR